MSLLTSAQGESMERFKVFLSASMASRPVFTLLPKRNMFPPSFRAEFCLKKNFYFPH